MSEKKIKILFVNLDSAGVNYFRTQMPAVELERLHSDRFQVEINPNLDFKDPNTLTYLKSFDIIHYHRQILNDANQMGELVKELKKAGVTLIVDIDDYWNLNKNHPYYAIAKERNLHVPILKNLKLADYVTTTSEIFANKIKEITGKDNVKVLYNSIDPDIMLQFKDKWKPDPNGKVRIVYAGGSSHWGDIQQLEGVANALNADPDLKDKFKFILAGWDTAGSTTEIKFNEDFGKELQERGLWNQSLINSINKSKGNIYSIPNLPSDLISKYKNKVFLENKRDLKSEESVYLKYEKILTDNHRIIKNKDYFEWLMNFERGSYYDDEGVFARRWTKKANIYATVLNEADIVLAPLDDNEFNHMKSNLKQVECWSRKLPIICNDIPPYNVDGKHMENCILIPNKKNKFKYWKKYLKKLILDSDLRKQLGEQLYEDFKEKYNLVNVTGERADFYTKCVIENAKNNPEIFVQKYVVNENKI
jgi:glycosyltransferase involved in cell wall biosynthesis